MRCLINMIPKVERSHHHIRITKEAKGDILWWVDGLDFFHGTTLFVSDVPLPSYVFSCDACEKGAGMHFNNDWAYFAWEIDCPEYAGKHINILELKAVVLAAERWGSQWAGLHILVRTDNMATVAAVIKTSSRSPELLELIRQLFWLSVIYNFKITAKYIPGVENVMSDRISRLTSVSAASDVISLLTGVEMGTVFCAGHMTHQSYMYLQTNWRMGSVS